MEESSRSRKHHRSSRHHREKRERSSRDDRRPRRHDSDGSDGHDRDGKVKRDKRNKSRNRRDSDNNERDRNDRGQRRRDRDGDGDSRGSSSNNNNNNKNDDDDDSSTASSRDRDDRRERSLSKRKHRDRHRGSSSRKESSSSSKKRKKKKSRDRDRHYSDDDGSSSSNSDGSRSASRDRKRKKRKKSSSKSRHEKKDKKSSSSAKDPSSKPKKADKSGLFSMGGPYGHPPETSVNAEEDYFSYHQQFWVYLFREEGTCFNDIDTKDAHAAFARFAKEYNAGRLEEPYYTRSFPNEVVEESKTTKHAWGFKTTHKERKGLGDLQMGVRRQTEYSKNSGDPKPSGIGTKNISVTISSQTMTKPAPAVARCHRLTPEERLRQRRGDKRLKEHVKLAQEELAGGPKDLKERRLEKKREHSARIHGAHRDREGDSVGMELSDAALFGGGGEKDSFRSALARSRQNKDRRNERRQGRIEELQSKEKERQQNMLKMLGLENLQGKGKVQIAPRK